jgi:hypothetical protein
MGSRFIARTVGSIAARGMVRISVSEAIATVKGSASILVELRRFFLPQSGSSSVFRETLEATGFHASARV